MRVITAFVPRKITRVQRNSHTLGSQSFCIHPFFMQSSYSSGGQFTVKLTMTLPHATIILGMQDWLSCTVGSSSVRRLHLRAQFAVVGSHQTEILFSNPQTVWWKWTSLGKSRAAFHTSLQAHDMLRVLLNASKNLKNLSSWHMQQSCQLLKAAT